MQEVGDLKERLLMGQDEYKTQFVECARMKRELSRKQKSGECSCGGCSQVCPWSCIDGFVCLFVCVCVHVCVRLICMTVC